MPISASISAVAELTPDKKDFIITYVVEEGQRYKFGNVTVESQLRDFDSGAMTRALPMHKGDWYNAKQFEDTIDRLTETAGTFGYAFADVRPDFNRNPDTLTMDVKFVINEAPRVYVERIDVNGNTLTQDKVIRREFRIAEGDAFNSLQVKRTHRPHQRARLLPGELRGRPGRRQRARPDHPRSQRAGTGDRRAVAVGGLLEPRELHFQGSIRQSNFRGRGPDGRPRGQLFELLAVGPAQLHRAGAVRPEHLGRYRPLPQRLQQRLLNRATATYEQSTTGSRCGWACR